MKITITKEELIAILNDTVESSQMAKVVGTKPVFRFMNNNFGEEQNIENVLPITHVEIESQ